MVDTKHLGLGRWRRTLDKMCRNGSVDVGVSGFQRALPGVGTGGAEVVLAVAVVHEANRLSVWIPPTRHAVTSHGVEDLQTIRLEPRPEDRDSRLPAPLVVDHQRVGLGLSLIHISEPTRLLSIS